METTELIEIFAGLGNYLLMPNNQAVEEAITKTISNNQWFTNKNVHEAVENIARNLTKENLQKWLLPYQNLINSKQHSKMVAIVMAGNIPLVGFHDFISVLITGNKALVKLSSNDMFLLPCIAAYLNEAHPYFKTHIEFATETIKGYDAVIATGSNNTARYFEYYFGKVPNVIRKNRNSFAVLTGNESEQDLKALADDIFMYMGLGCRNVSKLFLPQNYNFEKLMTSIQEYDYLKDHNKYRNNYDYQKAILSMNSLPFVDAGFAIFRENDSLVSPIGVIHYSFYNTAQEIEQYVAENKEQLQCIVSGSDNWSFKTVAFGETQKPNFWDYADEVDTIDFLIKNEEVRIKN